MSKFKVNQRVRCVEPIQHMDCLVKDQIYTVKELSAGNMVLLEGHEVNGAYFDYRFEAIVEPKKPIRTSQDIQTVGGGKKVRLISTSAPAPYVLVGYIDGNPDPLAWNLLGDVPPGKHYPKIENVPEPKKEPQAVWVNVYKDRDGKLSGNIPHPTRQKADNSASLNRVGRLKVELKEEFHE